jgi:catechol 2,3-dioxygenase
MTELAHIVYYVRNLDASTRFYEQAVGLMLKGKVFGGRAAVLSGGQTHHELLLIEVGDAEGPPMGRRIGLYHAGWKIGESLEELRNTRDRLAELGYPLEGMSDHTVSQSLYLRDPDGNEVELFVDDPDYDWSKDDSWMEAPVKPLDL